MTWAEIREVFAELPHRYRAVLALADETAESGPESLIRLILRQLGLRFETQVVIPGVGRVDFLVEGWLIVECDSKAHHEGWEKQQRDRPRDLAAAALGYATLRPLAGDIMYRRESVVAAVRGIVRARRRPPA